MILRPLQANTFLRIITNCRHHMFTASRWKETCWIQRLLSEIVTFKNTLWRDNLYPLPIPEVWNRCWDSHPLHHGGHLPLKQVESHIIHSSKTLMALLSPLIATWHDTAKEDPWTGWSAWEKKDHFVSHCVQQTKPLIISPILPSLQKWEVYCFHHQPSFFNKTMISGSTVHFSIQMMYLEVFCISMPIFLWVVKAFFLFLKNKFYVFKDSIKKK